MNKEVEESVKEIDQVNGHRIEICKDRRRNGFKTQTRGLVSEKWKSTSFEAGQKELKLQRWSIETINLIGSTSFMSWKDKSFSTGEKVSSKKFENVGIVME